MPPSASPASPRKRPPGGGSDPAPGPALSRPPLSKKLLLVSGLVLLADQLTKAAALRWLASVPTVSVLPGLFHLTLVENTGVAFGLFRGQGLAVTLATLAVLAGLGWSALHGTRQPPSRSTVLGLGLILGGAAGNLVDRARLGAVVDFLDFRVWPVFNVADSCITVGAVLVALQLMSKRHS